MVKNKHINGANIIKYLYSNIHISGAKMLKYSPIIENANTPKKKPENDSDMSRSIVISKGTFFTPIQIFHKCEYCLVR